MSAFGRALAQDVRVGAAASGGGVIMLGVVEWFATLRAHTGPVHLEAAARLALLDATLIAILWLAILPLCALAAVTPRLVRALSDGTAAAAAAPRLVSAPSRWAPHAAPAVLATGLAVVTYGVLVTWVGAYLFPRYREPVLFALLVALFALAVLLGAALAARVAAAAFERARAPLARRWPRGMRWTPLGSAWLAFAVGCVLVVIALAVASKHHPHLRPVWPWRRMLALVAFLAGAGIQLELAARWPVRRRSRRTGLLAALPALVLIPLTLVRCGGEPEVKYLAVTASPTLASAIDFVRKANDLDGDGFGSLLGENDCAPRNRSIRPGVRDLPDNGIDENCDGRDFSMRDLIQPSGPDLPVPPAFQKPWNVLFITIDTVRYDYTSFGGRKDGPKKRDTTPRLAELVSRSTSFTFAQAPSAGTMASVPAILTSKFFHSGIALDEKVKHPMPPRVKKENTTIAEIMKRGGYQTGAILTHEYFNDWGLDQGFDEYDNEIGKTHDAYRVSANRVTDRALAWIARRPHGKWFLWTHYLDPHSQYVAHPGEKSFGDSQEDLYEGELHFTDKHVGRLLDELVRLPGGDRTIVVITSDHGDAFGEHGFYGHAVALSKEVIHVPLIFYIPDNPPHQIGGAVSNLDALPTVAALCGIDVSDLSFEGKSLVPQIFYEKEEPDRAVFSETNYPSPLRAAVTSKWKLIYNMKGNFHELYDLTKDPLEKVNIASREKTGMEIMRPILDAWLERVVFSRDASMSQAAMRMSKVLLAAPPSPTRPTPGLTLDDGAIEVLGFDVTQVQPGTKPSVVVFMKVVSRPKRALKLGAVMWAVATEVDAATTPLGSEQARSLLRVTLDGLLPSDRWKPGEYIREELQVTMPAAWSQPFAAVGLVASGTDGTAGWKATHPGGDNSLGFLGVVPVVGFTKPAELPSLVPPAPAPIPAR